MSTSLREALAEPIGEDRSWRAVEWRYERSEEGRRSIREQLQAIHDAGADDSAY